MSDTLPPEIRSILATIGEHLGRIEDRLTVLEKGLTDLRVEVAALKGQVDGLGHRMDALPTTLQVFGIVFGLLIGLPVLATIGVFVARTLRLI